MRQAEPGWLKAWDELDRELRRQEERVLLVLLAAVVIVVLVQFVHSFSGGAMSDGLHDLPGAMVLAVALLSATLATSACCCQSQSRPLQSPRRRRLSALRWFLAAFACAGLALAAVRYLAFAMHMGALSPLDLSRWWELALMPPAFVLMSLRLLRRALRDWMPATT